MNLTWHLDLRLNRAVVKAILDKSKLQKEAIAHVGQMRSLSASERAVKG